MVTGSDSSMFGGMNLSNASNLSDHSQSDRLPSVGSAPNPEILSSGFSFMTTSTENVEKVSDVANASSFSFISSEATALNGSTPVVEHDIKLSRVASTKTVCSYHLTLFVLCFNEFYSSLWICYDRLKRKRDLQPE